MPKNSQHINYYLPNSDGDFIGLHAIGYDSCDARYGWCLPLNTKEACKFKVSQKHRYSFQNEARDLCAKRLLIHPWGNDGNTSPDTVNKPFYWLGLSIKALSTDQKCSWPKWIVLTTKDLNELTCYLKASGPCTIETNAQIEDYFREITRLIDKNNISMIRLYINKILTALLELFKKKKVISNQNLNENSTSKLATSIV